MSKHDHTDDADPVERRCEYCGEKFLGDKWRVLCAVCTRIFGGK